MKGPTAIDERLVEALDALERKITSMPRRRDRVEAPIAYTHAYVAGLVAVACARLGARDPARARIDRARIALTPVIHDRVHSFLVELCAARVEMAIANQPDGTPPDPLIAELEALDRVPRYKVDRLREASLLLEPLPVDAIGDYSQRRSSRYSPASALLDALREITDPAARAAHIDQLVDATPADPDLLAACLDALPQLSEVLAVPALVRVIACIQRLPEPPAELCVRALTVAARFTWGELVPDLVVTLQGALRRATAQNIERALGPTIQALRRLELTTELAELLPAFEHAIADGSPTHFVLAAAYALVGDPGGPTTIDRAAAQIAEIDHPPHRLERLVALARAAGYASIDVGLAWIDALADHVSKVTDSFGTNSHFCFSVLHLADSLALGIVRLGEPRPVHPN